MFTVLHKPSIWSFHVTVLQRTAKKYSKISKALLDRRESLSVKLFNDIVSKEDQHKLASLLPPMGSSYAQRLRNKKCFDIPVRRTDRFRKSFIISSVMKNLIVIYYNF